MSIENRPQEVQERVSQLVNQEIDAKDFLYLVDLKVPGDKIIKMGAIEETETHVILAIYEGGQYAGFKEGQLASVPKANLAKQVEDGDAEIISTESRINRNNASQFEQSVDFLWDNE